MRGVVTPAQVDEARRRVAKFQCTNVSRYTYHQRRGSSFGVEVTESWLVGYDNGKTQCHLCNILRSNHFVKTTMNDKFARGEQMGFALTHQALDRHTVTNLHKNAIL